MKRGSARLIILLLGAAAIAGVCSHAIAKILPCRNTFVVSYCQGLRMQLYLEVAAIILIVIAAWVWTKQLS